MLSELQLPPGFAVRIEVDPTMERNVRVTVFRDGLWLAEVSSKAAIVDRPGNLQQLVDVIARTRSRGNGLKIGT